jgi:hypothetical protein
MSVNQEIKEDTIAQVAAQVQADKRGCCSSNAKEAVVDDSNVQLVEAESRGCCKTADVGACPAKDKTDAEIKVEAEEYRAASCNKPVTDADGKSQRVGCCSKVVERPGSSSKKISGCCSSVESPGLKANAKSKTNVNDCCASKSNLDITKADVYHDNVNPPASKDELNKCPSSEGQKLSRRQEIVPPCCEGIGSNCCDGRHSGSDSNIIRN